MTFEFRQTCVQIIQGMTLENLHALSMSSDVRKDYY